MKNDGHGHLAEIPSLFISNTDGENLRANNVSCLRTLVRVHFEMDQLETSEVILWLDAGNVALGLYSERRTSWRETSTRRTTTMC